MVCKRCGIELRETDAVCPRCSTPVDKTSQQNIPVIEFPEPVVEEPPKKNKKLLPIIIGLLGLIIIIVGICIFIFSNNDTGKNVDNESNTTTEEEYKYEYEYETEEEQENIEPAQAG